MKQTWVLEPKRGEHKMFIAFESEHTVCHSFVNNSILTIAQSSFPVVSISTTGESRTRFPRHLDEQVQRHIKEHGLFNFIDIYKVYSNIILIVCIEQ